MTATLPRRRPNPGGAAFFDVPLVQKELARSLPARFPTRALPAPRPNPLILVIEDDTDTRELLESILAAGQFRVALAGDGHAGVAIARRMRPDVILCDVEMPSLDGYGVLADLRADPAFFEVPFVFLTAHSQAGDLRHGMNSGADDYLTKPFSSEDLIATIRARLARQQLHHQHTRQMLAQSHLTPDFSSSVPLRSLGITGREAEVLLWAAQGKTNAEIGVILGMSEMTVKKHMQNLFAKTGFENRNAAIVRALELLSRPSV